MILPGTTYRTNRNLQVSGTIHFDKPFSGGFDFDLPVNEDFKISVWTEPYDNYIQVWLLNSKKYESTIVDKEFFSSPYYDSFSLLLTRNVIENNCTLTTDFGNAIYFYSTKDKFGEFSNFSDYGFEFEHFYYPTVEHFYQSQKFLDKDYSEQIRKAKTAKDASDLGKNRAKKLKDDWDYIKTDIMTLGVQRKFETHRSLKDLLLSTDESLLIENSPYDNFWGIGQTGEGFNQLGTILMRVRQRLKNAIE